MLARVTTTPAPTSNASLEAAPSDLGEEGSLSPDLEID